jgi:dethiobiotin synthetase
MTAVFVTGSGTGVGKTFITAALIRHLRAAGRAVDAMKPVVSGFDDATLAESDPGVLLAALDRAPSPQALDAMSPWRFAAPLSPDMAAARAGRSIDFTALVARCEAAMTAFQGTLFIEGVGGVMVPLDGTHTVLDWMTALGAPVLLVAGSYLGTISHTLTALQVLTHRNLDVAAVAVSESEGDHGGAPLDETVATITRFADSIPVIGVSRFDPQASSDPAIGRIAGHLR